MSCTSVLAATFACAALIAGCANVAPPPNDREPRTASDQSEGEKRARVRLELAGLYLGRGQANTALDEVKRALAAKPDMAEAYSLRGLVYASLGETTLAEESFQRALQLAPRDGDTMQNYGWFLCQQRRFAEADLQFVAALAQPQYRELVRTLLAQGVCQARAGRWADAERTLSRSYELDSANPVTAYNLSDVLMQRGELDRARFYVGRINAVPALTTAQSLWLAARIERRLGNPQAVQEVGRQLRERYPQSDEALLFERGRFDE
jgi:type IV pilus assembly protein PilF